MQKILFLLPLIFALLVSGTVEAKKKKYPNGDYYEGEWKNGKPHGNGKMIFSNGSSYDGIWDNGKIVQGSAEIKLYDDNQVFRGNLSALEGTFISGYYFSGFDYNNNSLIMEGDFLEEMSTFFSGKFTLKTLENVFVFYGSISNDGKFNGKMNYMQNQYTDLTAKYDGGLDNILRSGNGDLSFSKYEMKISGFWSDDMLMQGSGSFVYDGTLCNFNIKQSDPMDYNSSYIVELSNPYNETNYLKLPFNDNLESIPDLITMEYRKKADIEIKKRRELAEQKRIQEEENKKKEAERKRIEQERIEQERAKELEEQNALRQEFIAQKTRNFNINSYLWTASEINRLEEQNVAKFVNLLKYGKVLIYGAITDFFTGEGDNTAAAYWSNGLLPSSYTQYFIRLQGGIVVQAYSHEIENLSKGETVFILAELIKDDYLGYIFDARSETITSSLSEMKKKLCTPLDKSVQPKFEYENLNLVKNIYR